MPYEPGSSQCRTLISAKENIINAMSGLTKIEGMDNINERLKEIYKELDQIHESRKVLEKEI